MIDSLKIISRDRIVAFEDYSDEHAAKLAHEIEMDGKIHHPLLVYPLFDNYLLLDDACILRALEELEVIHVPVQLAKAGTLSVHPWQRVVEDWNRDNLIQFCAKFPRQIALQESFDGPIAPGQAEVRFRDGAAVRITFVSDALLVRVDMYNKLSSEITRGHQSFRAKLNLSDNDTFGLFPRATAALFPPMFTIDELAHMAVKSMKLAQGIIRIDQPGRVLGVDYALSILKEAAASEEKESFFRQLIQMRISSDRTAYYYGNVFMFNN